MKSSKLLCNTAPSLSSKSRTATRSCSPAGAPSRPPSGTQTSRPTGTSTGAPSDQQSIPSQAPVINDIENDELSEIEIKILKSKLIVDNNLEGLLDLENKIEPSIEDTINSRLEKDNLIQDAPGESINLSHLSDDLQQAFNNLITTYKEAFSMTLDFSQGLDKGSL